MEFRLAVSSDALAIASALRNMLEIHHNGRPDLFREGATKYDEKAVADMIAEGKDMIYVAACGLTVCAYAICRIEYISGHPIRRDMKTMYLDDLCVMPEYRDRGIGHRFMNMLFDEAKKRGCDNFELNVWEFNSRAVSFYESCGLTVQRRRMEKHL